jgi:DNA-binding NarL/FixJ family response regulator
MHNPPEAGAAAGPALLLLEPYFVLRHTVVSVVQGLQLARITEASNLDAAHWLVANLRFDAFVLALGEKRDELALLRRLRAGHTRSAPSAPVAVMTETCDAELVHALRELGVMRVMLKPFKVKTALEVVQALTAPGH